MEHTSSSKAEKRHLQTQLIDARMQGNPRWNLNPAATSQRLVTVSERKQFVLWRAAGGKAQIVDTLRIEDIEASFTGGVTLYGTSPCSSTRVRISSMPREVFPGIWIWIPPIAELRFCPFSADDAHSVWRLTLPMCVRTPAEQQVSFSTAKEFHDLWPNVTL